ncbi:MAG: Asd/ArgC dimerization domain-containing protein, partial [Candidatus Binatia bacterium]
PTGALIGLVPLARAGRIAAENPVVIDAKSGASGAGRSAKIELLFAELDENVRAYGVGKHRHLPEITQELAAAGSTARVIFTPHLLPLRRGLLSTIYVSIQGGAALRTVYEAAYPRPSFVELLPEGCFPEVRDVRGTNHAQIGWTVLEGNLAIVVTVIDNLGKGGAGQGVQCLNVMFGLDERTGLDHIAAVP